MLLDKIKIKDLITSIVSKDARFYISRRLKSFFQMNYCFIPFKQLSIFIIKSMTNGLIISKIVLLERRCDILILKKQKYTSYTENSLLS